MIYDIVPHLLHSSTIRTTSAYHINMSTINTVKHVRKPYLEKIFMQTQLANIGVRSVINDSLP